MENPVLTPQLHLFRQNPPVVVEIIDKSERIEKFAQEIGDVTPHGLMTIQPVGIRYYGEPRKKRCRRN